MDLMYQEFKSLGYGKKSRKGMWLIEDKNNEEITDKHGTWQKYVEELYETRNQPAYLDIENETDISEDEKGFPILMEKVEVGIKAMKNWKGTGVDGIPIELVKYLGKEKNEILSLCNKIYNEDQWPEEFMETVLLPIMKKNNAKECKEFRTISLISHCKD